jgi:hypothetical protein
MKVELHINGKLNIILIPEDSYDHNLLEGMIEASEKGKAVSLIREDKDGSFRGIVGVEK